MIHDDQVMEKSIITRRTVYPDVHANEHTFEEPEPDLHNSFSKSGTKTTQTVHANKRSLLIMLRCVFHNVFLMYTPLHISQVLPLMAHKPPLVELCSRHCHPCNNEL